MISQQPCIHNTDPEWRALSIHGIPILGNTVNCEADFRLTVTIDRGLHRDLEFIFVVVVVGDLFIVALNLLQ